MSEAVIIGITSATTLATVILGRLRCIFRPFSDGPCFQSACTDMPMEHHDDRQIALQDIKIRDQQRKIIVLVENLKELNEFSKTIFITFSHRFGKCSGII